MKLETTSIGILERAIGKLSDGFGYLPDCSSTYDVQKAERVLLDVAKMS